MSCGHHVPFTCTAECNKLNDQPDDSLALPKNVSCPPGADVLVQASQQAFVAAVSVVICCNDACKLCPCDVVALKVSLAVRCCSVSFCPAVSTLAAFVSLSAADVCPLHDCVDSILFFQSVLYKYLASSKFCSSS